ncbi:MAG: hypothetical protein K9N09_03800 [Candidatus Cloacimonetes bacterium]|nr:hypothetical protein [Candidatus Cloacimonadota bacterium]MCF7813736.1 hypothetical protein [Candidatus Cloacimonadota bacterium]MCF7867802.1 hypothetical protein [Candidatus Cloacimonadota bacterium]MCF7883220.1 hypothetical protein [Candidatus Cloacimonadota bacterium]
MKKIIPVLISQILISCYFNSQNREYLPVWWEKEEPGYVCSYGIGVNDKEHIARLAAQNDAYYNYPDIITKYMNDFVAKNCIEPGDEQIQKKLDRIFLNFNNYYTNIKSPAISVGLSESIELRLKGKKHFKYFVQLQISDTDLHAAFVEYLETSDLYILPKLRLVLKECFS